MAKKRSRTSLKAPGDPDYGHLVSDISTLLDVSRRATVRAINGILTATYWDVGRRIVEFEQGGKARAEYGEALLHRLGTDLTARHGRGFSWRNLFSMRNLYLGWEVIRTESGKLGAFVRGPTAPDIAEEAILQTASAKSERRDEKWVPADLFDLSQLATAFPLPWSHYVRLLSVSNVSARAFYEVEAVRGAWTVRQLDRQINSMFYERVALSRRKATMLEKGQQPRPEDEVSVREQIRDPYVLEFLDLKDEYAEDDLEEALVRHLEGFLLEMGTGFTFVARQKSIRIGNENYRMDLLLFHRVLRCLVIIDLKRGKFTHADAGQMNLYLNYSREHLMMAGENEPIGLILCSDKDDAVVRYATGGIAAKVFASQYLVALPDEETLREEILATQRALALRAASRGTPEGG